MTEWAIRSCESMVGIDVVGEYMKSASCIRSDLKDNRFGRL